jgi:DNA-binding CsgD family transcriptional regulator
MFDSFDPSQLLRQILGLQKVLYTQEDNLKIALKESYINEFSKSGNSLRIIFDHVNFKILHISDNIETIAGYSVKDFGELNMLFALRLFTLEHYNFMYIWLQWAISLHTKLGSDFKPQQAICGVKVKHKDGHIMRLLFRHYTLEAANNGAPTLAAITLDDITHLIKSDFYWGRITCGRTEKHVHHLYSTDKEDIPHDILSDREKDTLRLLAQGKESKKIGLILEISSHTVDNHRRNMINKLGVRDTTGLVQICKMVGII